MATMQLKVVEKSLELTNAAEIIAGEVNATDCVFTFDSTWNGTTKTAVFCGVNGEKAYRVLNNDSCKIPWEAVATSGILLVGVFTIKQEQAIGTNFIEHPIFDGTPAALTPIPTELVYMQIVGIMAQSEKLVEDANKAAEKYNDDLYNYIDPYKNCAPFGKCFFNYEGYIVADDLTVEESARILSRYDLVCCAGLIDKWTYTEGELATREKEFQIVQRTREINPKVKFFRYVTANSVFAVDGVTKIDATKTDLFNEIHGTLHVGGTRSELTDENGYYTYVGGIAYDGIMWDEAESYSDVGVGKSWGSVVGKQNALITECHAYSLSAFMNVWNVDKMLSNVPTADDYNPQGIASVIGQTAGIEDYLLFESTFFYANELNDGWAYWSGASVIDKVYNYIHDYYPQYKARAVTFSTSRYNVPVEAKEMALTWMIWCTLAIGGHYVVHDGGFKNWNLPKEIDLFRIDKSMAPSITKNVDGYTYKANGHTLRVKWNSAIASARATVESFAEVQIIIDNLVVFNNSQAHQYEKAYRDNERLALIEENVVNLSKLNKGTANHFVRALIDDKVKTFALENFTNIFPAPAAWNKSSNVLINGSGYDVVLDFNAAQEYIKYTVDVSQYAGHTIEIGFTLFTQDTTEGGSCWGTLYTGAANNWALDITPGTRNPSSVGNIYNICKQWTVPVGYSGIVSFKLYAAGGPCVATIKGLYMVDTSELDIDAMPKEWYTNKFPVFTVDNILDNKTYVAVTANDPYTVSILDENSISVAYDEGDNLSWTGPYMDMPYATYPLIPGHRYEMGCASFDTNAGDNVKFRLFYKGYGYLGDWISPTNLVNSELFNDTRPCVQFTIPETATAGMNAYWEMCLTEPQSYSVDGNGVKTTYSVAVHGMYLYDLDEDNVIARGVEPVNTYLRFARVADTRLNEPSTLQSDTVYFTVGGHIYLTDYNKNITQYI